MCSDAPEEGEAANVDVEEELDGEGQGEDQVNVVKDGLPDLAGV